MDNFVFEQTHSILTQKKEQTHSMTQKKKLTLFSHFACLCFPVDIHTMLLLMNKLIDICMHIFPLP